MGGAERSRLEAKNDGIVKFSDNLKSVVNKEGSIIVVNRSASIAILDHRQREIEHYQVPYGANILVNDMEEIKAHQEFAEWDPFNTFIISNRVIRHSDTTTAVSGVSTTMLQNGREPGLRGQSSPT